MVSGTKDIVSYDGAEHLPAVRRGGMRARRGGCRSSRVHYLHRDAETAAGRALGAPYAFRVLTQ
jgi:hypothetical protein